MRATVAGAQTSSLLTFTRVAPNPLRRLFKSAHKSPMHSVTVTKTVPRYAVNGVPTVFDRRHFRFDA